MRFSWNNVVKAMSLGGSEAGIRLLRSRVQRYIDSNGNAFGNLAASVFDHELEKIEKDIHEDLKRLLNRFYS